MIVEYGIEKAQAVMAKHGIDLEEVKHIIELGKFKIIKPNPKYPHQIVLLIQYQ